MSIEVIAPFDNGSRNPCKKLTAATHHPHFSAENWDDTLSGPIGCNRCAIDYGSDQLHKFSAFVIHPDHKAVSIQEEMQIGSSWFYFLASYPYYSPVPLLSCKVSMKNWQTYIDQYAKQTNREVIVLSKGRGVAFGDGIDVCWLLPDDVLSTLPAPTDEPTAQHTIAEIERIDRIRSDVLHVLRHYLASKRYGITRNKSGDWGIQSEGGMSSSICVGAYLTSIARDGNDVAGCLNQLLKNSIVRHPPSARRIQRYMDTAGDPPGERGFEDKSITLGGDTMASILKMMNLCRAAEAIPDEPSESDGKKFVDRVEHIEATGPVGQALLRVGERLPEVKPTFELFENSITLDFPDGLDSIDIKVKSRELIRAIRDDRPMMAGDRIADDFERLCRLRAITLNAIDSAAVAMGWTIEQANTGLFSGSTVWHLGQEVRSRTIDVGKPMTEALRKSSPEIYLQSLADGSNDPFVSACLDAIHKAGPLNPKPSVAPRGRLAPALPVNVPTLADLTDAAIIAETDRWAAETLRAFKQSDDIWTKLDDRLVFDASIDTWMTSSEVLSMAAAVTEDSWYYATAIRMLLDTGHVGAEQKAKELVERSGELYEVGDDLIELAWHFRNEFPVLAMKNFAPQPYDDVPNSGARAKAGDPIAMRFVAAQNTGNNDDADATWMEALALPLRVQSPHDCACEWAKREWRWSVVDITPFEMAIRAGWSELADALDENPYIISTLLTHEPRGIDGFDAPGLLMADKLLLAWSRLRPTPLLAKLIVTARSMDLVGAARAAEDASARRNPKIEKRDVTIAKDVMSVWWEKIQPPLAIAWTRWRQSGRKVSRLPDQSKDGTSHNFPGELS